MKDKPFVAWIATKDLRLMPKGNRRIMNEAEIHRIAREFNWDLLTVLIVGPNDGQGKYSIADGQHRWRAVHDVLGWRDEKLPCWVVPTAADAARLAKIFLGVNGVRTSVKPIDIFKSEVVAEVPQALAIQRVLERAGFRVEYQVSERSIPAVNAIRGVFKDAGESGLALVLETIKAAWPTSRERATQGVILRGLGRLLAKYDGAVEQGVLVTKLSKHATPDEIIAQAKASMNVHGSTLPQNVAAVMVAAYNKGRRSGQLADFFSRS